MRKEDYALALDSLEEALCARYHVPSLDGLGPLGEAMVLARRGDLAPITAAMEGREMYRWREAAEAALVAARDAAGINTAVAKAASGSEPEPAIPPAPEPAPESDADPTVEEKEPRPRPSASASASATPRRRR